MLSKYYSVFLFPRSSHCVSYIHKWRISINSGHHRRPFCFFSSFGCKIPGPENEHVGGVILTRKEQNKHKKNFNPLPSVNTVQNTHSRLSVHTPFDSNSPPTRLSNVKHTHRHTHIHLYLSICILAVDNSSTATTFNLHHHIFLLLLFLPKIKHRYTNILIIKWRNMISVNISNKILSSKFYLTNTIISTIA